MASSIAHSRDTAFFFATLRKKYCRPAESLGIGAIVYSVMAKGLLAGKYKPGHQFPPDDERHNWPHFKGELFERIYAVTEKLKAWAQDHGQRHRAACHRLAPGQPCRYLEHRRRTHGRPGASRRAGGGLGADRRRSAREIDEIQGDLRLDAVAIPRWSDRAKTRVEALLKGAFDFTNSHRA